MIRRTDFYYFLTLGILAVTLFGFPKVPHRHHIAPTTTTKEQRASHMITFLDDDGERKGVCTGTSTGPHSLLTAEHCNAEGDSTQITIDRSTEKHKLLAAAGDGRDHVIYLLDGAAFTNYEVVKQVKPVLGETVTMYGDGESLYPPVPRYGKVFSCEDPSDLDESAGQECSTLQVIPGDSGSAVYNVRGEIVGTVTYQSRDEDGKVSEIGFALNFEQDKLDVARTFDGTPEDLPTRKK
jgi:hypothetical protein